MGLQIGDIVTRREIKFEDLKGRIVAVDAFNAIYQFLSSIRQPDGTPLMDSKGRVTSHLSGLFYRNIALLSEGIKLAYVFDGEYSELKGKTQEGRELVREKMRDKYAEARDEGDVGDMAKYSRGFMKLDKEMIADSKELLEALGICVVQAPGEGEMQAAELVKRGEAYAVASQDYDALVVGANRLIQNLTLARKRKLANGSFVYIAPEMIEYERTINELGINGDQLICLAILVGTDFNPGGVRGLGPKKALVLVKDRKFPVKIFEYVQERFGELEFNWQEVFQMFKKPNADKVELDFPKINEESVKDVLVERHEFSPERVENQLLKLRDVKKKAGQKRLF